MSDDPSRRLSSNALALLDEIAVRIEAGRRLELGSSEAVLRSIVDATVSLFQAEAASIALYDVTTDRLIFGVAAGEQGQGAIGLSVPPSEGLVGYVYTTGQAIALSDVANDSRFGRQYAEKTAYVPRSIVAVPLVDEHGTIGVLEVLDKRDSASFSLRDIELASIFARQAAVAISSSRVERDATSLLRAALRALIGDGGSPSHDESIDEIAGAATASLQGDDESGLWALVEQVARARRADPSSVGLVADLLAVLASHAEATGRTRGGAGRR